MFGPRQMYLLKIETPDEVKVELFTSTKLAEEWLCGWVAQKSAESVDDYFDNRHSQGYYYSIGVYKVNPPVPGDKWAELLEDDR